MCRLSLSARPVLASGSPSSPDERNQVKTKTRRFQMLPLMQTSSGGGTTLTGTGIARNTGACTELSGDVTTSGSNTVTIKTSVALAGSPTTTTQAAFDNSTNVATTAYVDGEVGHTVSSPDFTGIPCEYWNFASATSTTSQSTGTGDTYFVFFTLDRTVTFTKMTVYIAVASNGNHLMVGIYNAAMTTKLVQGTFLSGAGTGAVQVTVSSTTLKPGTYCLAFGSDNATPVRAAGAPQLSNAGTILNTTSTRTGFTTNAPSGTTLPANLLSSGSITPSATIIPPFVLLEP